MISGLMCGCVGRESVGVLTNHNGQMACSLDPRDTRTLSPTNERNTKEINTQTVKLARTDGVNRRTQR